MEAIVFCFVFIFVLFYTEISWVRKDLEHKIKVSYLAIIISFEIFSKHANADIKLGVRNVILEFKGESKCRTMSQKAFSILMIYKTMETE